MLMKNFILRERDLGVHESLHFPGSNIWMLLRALGAAFLLTGHNVSRASVEVCIGPNIALLASFSPQNPKGG